MTSYSTEILTRPDLPAPFRTEGPESIWNILFSPERLYLRGSPEALALLAGLPSRGLGIVGTRNPQSRSLLQVRKTVLELENTDLIIISGLARGIDSAAHQTALDAGLPTIAVLGGGLDQLYPRENQDLANRILGSNGLLVSEFPDGVPPQPGFFIRRNRFIAGWARAVWVAEAGHRSGALNTAKWARDMARETYATPCFPSDPHLAGNQRLLDSDHARPLWASHNLGVTWLDLAARISPSTRREKLQSDHCSVEENELASRVDMLTRTKGGATADELLTWALSKEWSPQKFFLALNATLQAERVMERRGSFASCS
ncbi:MAG: hypothetical protein A2X94_06990 [Bdellovibrionales bacterium GWB1_55_8]|nr:MAG: hypothetical protein A2X94_06990 [Bdellovibrionales bacterium GWB1_55_8]